MSAPPVKILEWTAEYSVHVPEIDREHQAWFTVINRLHEAMLAGAGSRILATLLADMMQYTLLHFASEEKLMAAIHYAGRRAHLRQHDGLRRRAKAFAERFERGEATLTIELTLFLSEWIKHHTLTTDRQLGDAIMRLRLAEKGAELHRNVLIPEQPPVKRRKLPAPECPARILVASHDTGIRSFFRITLEQAGHQVMEAGNRMQAMKEARSGRVNLVIADLAMPDQEGVKTVRALRKELPGIGVIATSGAFGGQFLTPALVRAADAVLNQPVGSDLLLAKVTEVLQARR